jgi:hypothetical protein
VKKLRSCKFCIAGVSIKKTKHFRYFLTRTDICLYKSRNKIVAFITAEILKKTLIKMEEYCYA